jgi:hypothetical protein
MFGLSGIKCHTCGMAYENRAYAKGQHGEELYWADPKTSPHTDVRLDFCGLPHSAAWFASKQYEARKDVTQGTDQSAG